MAVNDNKNKNSMASLRDQAYERIRSKIILGRLAPGNQISEPKLAEMLGLGRTPVREAIQQLESEGLVERMPRRGTMVRVPERSDIVDLYELREGLEGYAVMLATERISPGNLARLRTLCEQMRTIADELKKSGKKALTGPLMRRFLAADMGFHMLLISATNNQHIIKIISDSHVMSRIFGTPRQLHTLDIVETAYRVHSDILEAVESVDPEKARLLTMQHIHQSRVESLAHFDRQQPVAKKPADDVFKDLPLPAVLIEEFERMNLVMDDAEGE